jgi:hypothetical protein
MICRRVEVQIQATLRPVGDAWPASRHGIFIHWKRTRVLIELDDKLRGPQSRDVVCPYPKTSPDSSVFQPETYSMYWEQSWLLGDIDIFISTIIALYLSLF